MLGAIIGDIAGSRFERNNIKTKEFDLLTYRCQTTDDSIMTLAVAKALMECDTGFNNLSAAAIEKYGEDIDDFDEEELHAFVVPEGYHSLFVEENTEAEIIDEEREIR